MVSVKSISRDEQKKEQEKVEKIVNETYKDVMAFLRKVETSEKKVR